MTNPANLKDDELLAELGAIARVADPPPAIAFELGRSAFLLRRLDAELAELVSDSLLEASAVRATSSTTRLMTFEASGVTVEVQVTTDGTSSSILGVVLRPGAGSGGVVHLQTASGPLASSELDGDDRFEFTGVPASLARLRVEAIGEGVVTTEWINV